MKKVFLVSMMAVAASAVAADALVPIAGTVAVKVSRFTAAQAAQYRGGFVRDGEEVVCTVTTNADRICGAGWYATLNQRAPAALRISMEGKVEAGGGSGSVELYVDVSYMDGDHLWGQTSHFAPVPGDWRTRYVMLMPPKPIRSLGIYGIARRDVGLRARFRAPVIETFDVENGPLLFDGVPVKVAEPIGTPGFLLRDARAESGFAKVKDAARGVRLATACEEKGGAQFFDVTMTAEEGRDPSGAVATSCDPPVDRALTLVYALPLGGGTLTWFDSPRTRKDLTSTKGDYRETLAAPCGAGGFSRWPFLAAAVDGKGIAIGFDPRRPAFSRVSLQAGLRLLYAAFDVALVPEKKSARLGFVVFPFEAKDGFRGALEAYQRLFPEFNEVKQTKQGNWMAFRKISKVQGWEDFGFAIKEADNETAWDDAHGITTYRYTEPSTWWMAIKGKDGRAQATMDECVAEAERLAAKGHRYAQAWKACAMKDENGRPYGRILDTPWCNGVAWNLNGAPGQGAKGEFAAKLGDDHFAKNYRGTFPEGLDGEYIDSSEMYVTAPVDFNRANFAGMDTPLTWSTYNWNPGVFKGMVGYEYVRGAWRKVRPQHAGALVVARAVPGRDGHGDELGPQREVDADVGLGAHVCARALRREAVLFSDEHGVRHLHASSNHYFDNPAYYNRDRPLFKKYMPLCIRVGEAGWRPVNRLLASDSPDVITEQFGDRYATVYNLSAKPVRVTLTSLSGTASADELVNGGTWRFENGRRTVEIPGETVFVLSFPQASK